MLTMSFQYEQRNESLRRVFVVLEVDLNNYMIASNQDMSQTISKQLRQPL